jgi:hypothetical protein
MKNHEEFEINFHELQADRIWVVAVAHLSRRPGLLGATTEVSIQPMPTSMAVLGWFAIVVENHSPQRMCGR